MTRRKKKVSQTFKDGTVVSVMVGNQWFPVKPGSWFVDLRGPYLHAAWRDPQGVKFTAFITKVQMVRHT